MTARRSEVVVIEQGVERIKSLLLGCRGSGVSEWRLVNTAITSPLRATSDATLARTFGSDLACSYVGTGLVPHRLPGLCKVTILVENSDSRIPHGTAGTV